MEEGREAQRPAEQLPLLLTPLGALSVVSGLESIRHVQDWSQPRWHSSKESACQCRRHKRRRFSPWVGKIPLEEEMATHSSILAWTISWTEEPGRLQSMGSQRGEND